MHMTTKVQGMHIAMDLYRLPNQPNFDGDLAADTDGYQGSVKSPVIETTVPSTWKSQLVSGGVGLRTGGSQDGGGSIRVTVPVVDARRQSRFLYPQQRAGRRGRRV